MNNTENKPLMVLAGIGEGLGTALAARFAEGGYRVVGLSRSAREWPLPGYFAIACDLTKEAEVKATFEQIERQHGVPEVVIHMVGDLLIAPYLQLSAAAFEGVWRSMVLSAMLVSQQAVTRMLPAVHGTLLFAGATASLRGGARFAAFASAKFALRGLAQSLAREFHSQGIHVAHVILDGLIGDADGTELDPVALAESFWMLAHQPHSAWTHELDLRAQLERF
ncbi:SDR family NAD(P)-dependent oxidoreductase [Pseudomonas sp. NPDC086251]|jgi:NAD(P)-dependent dehydrogenase (short-subunit alcohol dehydrogenase family)|uniref:SDR family NAD(P)-dependent oxidoreductase n=1 Tax=Pseudomonas sp. NPDC086251 TaxID=3364431 RepID=UPI0038378889